jgi:hypothetical protein
MAPINLPDGSQVSEIVLPDGSTASEVLAPDGSTVFSAIPDQANLYARWDANEETFSNNATGVAPTDQAGSFDATGGNGVGFTTTGPNGNNAYVFDGSTDYAVVPNSTTDFEFLHDGTGGSIYVVADISNAPIFGLMASTGGFSGGPAMAFGTDGGSGVLNKISNSGGNTGGGSRTALIYESHYSTSSHYSSPAVQFQDNSKVRGYTPATGSGSSLRDFSMGAQATGSGSFLDGDILAIWVYDVQHDSATRSEVYTFLDNRYS